MKAGDIGKIVSAAFAAAALFACEDSTQIVKSPSGFSVKASKAVYAVGERVEFKLDTEADFVNFYSGEEGSAYEYKDKDRVYPDSMLLGFSTATYPDNGTNPQSGKLMWSNDFPGVYEPDWIRLSTWHDITDRIVYPQPSPTNYRLYDTPAVEIEDLFGDDKDSPIYFCWAFNTKANSIRNRFRIDNWHIYGADTGRDFYSFAQSKFVMVEGVGFDVESHASYYPRVTDKYIVWDGIASSTVYKDGWAISGPIYYSREINTGKDGGVTIKAIGDPVIKSHNHYYSKPGTYEAVFEAINASASGRKSAIAKITVTIEGDDSPDEQAIPIEVSAESLEIPMEAKTAGFNLRCAKAWTIASSDPLVTVNPSAGNAGDLYIVKVTVSDGAPSQSTLNIVSGEASKTIRITIQ